MTPTPRLGRFHVTLTSVQWFVACAVIVHAALVRFPPGEITVFAPWLVLPPLVVRVLVLYVAGALLAATFVRARGRGAVVAEAALGGAVLACAGLLLHVVLGDGGHQGTALSYAPWLLLVVLLLFDGSALRRLGRLFGVEWLKARRSVLFRGGLVGSGAIALLAGFTYDPLPGASGWSLLAHSLGAGMWGAEVFVLVLGATAISGEAGGGTLKMMLPHAYRRSDWILAKTLVLLLVALLFGLVVLAVSALHAHGTMGLGDVTRTLEPMFGETEGQVETFATAAVMTGHLRDVALAGFAALGTTALIGVLLSSFFDTVVVSLCTAFLLFAGLKFADVLLRLPREALEGIYAWYPEQLGELAGKLGRALNERWDEALLPEGLHLALVTSGLALLLAIRAFARRDLHA